MFKPARPAFTLVELLVTIAIIGILLGLLLPNLAAVQATAKAGAQSAILQSFGKGFIDFSTLDASGRLCTGAYDHMRDGDLTKIGWVADLVNGKYANPTKSFDPVNRMRINEKFAEAAGSIVQSSLNNVRWRTNQTFRADGTAVTARADAIGSTYFGTTQTVWDDGYNANFATTWQFSRGDNNITVDDEYATNASSFDGSKSPLDGDGPLSTQILGDATLKTSADKIPLLGPARVVNNAEAAFAATGVNAVGTVNAFIDPTGRRQPAKVGDFVIESFCDGPMASVTTTANPYKTAEKVYDLCDIVPNCRAKVTAIAGGKVMAGGFGNLLFADGSCRRINDNNGYGGPRGDSFIGPFRADMNLMTDNAVFDDGCYDEVRDDVYLGRMRTILTAGGGSAE